MFYIVERSGAADDVDGVVVFVVPFVAAGPGATCPVPENRKIVTKSLNKGKQTYSKFRHQTKLDVKGSY